MAPAQTAPYGSWRSPITADLIVADAVGLHAIALDGETVYWIETRPAEAGRSVLVRRAADGRIEDVTPQGMNVRTRVHEYGGGAYTVARRSHLLLELRRPAPVPAGSRRGPAAAHAGRGHAVRRRGCGHPARAPRLRP